MKKILCFVLAVVICVGLMACGEKSSDNDINNFSSNQSDIEENNNLASDEYVIEGIWRSTSQGGTLSLHFESNGDGTGVMKVYLSGEYSYVNYRHYASDTVVASFDYGNLVFKIQTDGCLYEYEKLENDGSIDENEEYILIDDIKYVRSGTIFSKQYTPGN